MLYHLECLNPPQEDMYLIKGHDARRGTCKSIMNTIWNSPTLNGAIRAVMKKHNMTQKIRPTLKKRTVLKLLDGLSEKHSQIIHYVGTGIGNDLQFLDSCISEKIMISMLNLGTVCLPVHDSFVVPWQYEEQLRETMIMEYMNVLGKEPIIDKK